MELKTDNISVIDHTKKIKGPIDKIFHLADIHLRLYNRQDEYNAVFETLYEKLLKRKTKNSIIFIAGDLFHSKNILSPELVYYGQKFLRSLSEIAPVVIIPGNHDMTMANKKRMDAITPVISSLKDCNIIYSKNTEILEFENLSIAHSSVYNQIQIPSDKLNKNKLKFATYHGVLNGSTNEYGFTFESDKFNITSFNGYDGVLLGDIHKLQNLQEYHIEEIEVDEDDLDKYLNDGYEISPLKLSPNGIKLEDTSSNKLASSISLNVLFLQSVPNPSHLLTKGIVK